MKFVSGVKNFYYFSYNLFISTQGLRLCD